MTLPYEALADIIDPESVIGHHARKDEKKSPEEVSPPEIVVEDDMIIIDTIKLDVRK